MEKRIINFKASGQSLQRISGIVTAASDTVRYFEARFVLDESWEDFDSVRAIWVNGDTSSVRVLNHGVCEIPSEVLTEKNKLKVNLVGSTSEGGALVDRLTTFQCPVFGVTAKVPIDSPNPPDIPASQVEQFAAIVRDDADRADAAAIAAGASAQSASESMASASASETAAAASASNAADSAQASADSATASANSAAASASSASQSQGYAQAASESAGSASGSADRSLASAQASASSATDSANSATASANSASASQTFANNAELHAHNAEISAQSAANSADEAEQAKDTILGMRADATTLPEGSDATASYSDGLLMLGIPRGDKGNPPNLSIGTVETLDPDEDATATITGTAGNLILSFGIPKGDQGDVSLDQLNDSLDTIREVVVGENLYNYNNYVVGAIQSNGSISTAGVWGQQYCGDYFEIEAGQTYYFATFSSNTASTNRRNILFFDSSKQPITGSYSSFTDYYPTATAPANAKYCRISWFNTTLPVFSKEKTTVFIPYTEVLVSKLSLDIDGEYKTASEVVDELRNSFAEKRVVYSRNMVDPDEIAEGKFLQDDGTLVTLASYSTTGYIPIERDQKITVSPKVRAAHFYDIRKGSVSHYNGDTQAPITFTASVDGYFRASFYKTDTAIIQAEYGDTATSYVPYSKKVVIEDDAHLSVAMTEDVESIIKGDGVLDVVVNGNDLTVTEPVNGKTLKRTYLITGRDNKNFNFSNAYLDTTYIKGCGDDITPQRLRFYRTGGSGSQWTVGANHGWMGIRIPKGSLTQEDCGSIWTDGTRNYTLMVFESASAIFGCPCYKNGDNIVVDYTFPTADLTHVSGATHTGTVSVSGGTTTQFYPAINHRTVKLVADGKEVTEDGYYTTNKLSVIEHYEIMDYVDMVTTMQNNIGSSLANLKDSIDSILALDYVYEIMPQTEVVYTTATAITEVGILDSGFMQAESLQSNSGTVYRYANGIKDGSPFASSSLHDMTNYSEDIRILSTDLIDTNKPTDRVVDICMASGQILYGFTIGFIPDISYGADAKRKDASYVWDMRSTHKIYPSCITDKTLASGESVGVVGYRHYLVSPQDITNKTVIEVSNKQYAFIDAHEQISDSVDVGSIGDAVVTIDSSNMSTQDFVGANGVPFSSSSAYSTAVLKI